MQVPPPKRRRLSTPCRAPQILPPWREESFKKIGCCIENGPILPLDYRMKYVWPRYGFPIRGRLDVWHGFDAPESIRLPQLTRLAYMYASKSDTLLQNKAAYDAHYMVGEKNVWEGKHPGQPYVFHTTMEKAAKSRTWNSTLVLDIEYKRRLPKEGLSWVYTRGLTSSLERGKMEKSAYLWEQTENMLLSSKHVMLVLESRRRFNEETFEERKVEGSKL